MEWLASISIDVFEHETPEAAAEDAWESITNLHEPIIELTNSETKAKVLMEWTEQGWREFQ